MLSATATGARGRLPRSEGRGPIEALLLLERPSSPWHGLPRSEGRGPIEAVQTTASRPAPRSLPRSEGRGPIEAQPAAVGQLALALVSHGQKAVDPLKLPSAAPLHVPCRCLPRSEGRGPIEAP